MIVDIKVTSCPTWRFIHEEIVAHCLEEGDMRQDEEEMMSAS